MEAIPCVFCLFQKKVGSQGVGDQCLCYFLVAVISKLLTVSYSLLDSSTLHNNAGETVAPTVLLFDASVEYFSRQHLPFAVLAISVLLVFVILPLLPPVPYEIIPEMSSLLY